MCYLKIMNTFLKSNAFWSKLSEKLKHGIKILVVQKILELLTNNILHV